MFVKNDDSVQDYRNALKFLLNPSSTFGELLRDLIHVYGVNPRLTHVVSFHNFRDPSCVYCLQQFVDFRQETVQMMESTPVPRIRKVPMFMSMIDMIDKYGRNGIYHRRETEVLDALFYEIDPIDPKDENAYNILRKLLKNSMLVAVKMLAFTMNDNNAQHLRPRYVVNGSVVDFNQFIDYLLSQLVQYADDQDPETYITLQCGYNQAASMPQYPAIGWITYPMTEFLRIASCPFMVNQDTYPQIELYDNFITDDFVIFSVNTKRPTRMKECDGSCKCSDSMGDASCECAKGCGCTDTPVGVQQTQATQCCCGKRDTKAYQGNCGRPDKKKDAKAASRKMPVPRYMNGKKPGRGRRKTPAVE